VLLGPPLFTPYTAAKRFFVRRFNWIGVIIETLTINASSFPVLGDSLISFPHHLLGDWQLLSPLT
jgi:hypothetical protein